MSSKLAKWSVLPAAVLLLGTVALAQDQSSGGSSSTPAQGSSTQSSTPAPAKPTIAQRKENQQDRIAQGVKSGQLTAGETANLETKEAAINGETRADRAANGGKLTGAEKQQVNQQQNQLSKQIYNDKHNAATQNYGKSEVGQRQTNQQQRIAQGIKSGQLTAGETAKLENQQRGINQQVKADRAANGGKLTTARRSRSTRNRTPLPRISTTRSTTPTHSPARRSKPELPKESRGSAPRNRGAFVSRAVRDLRTSRAREGRRLLARGVSRPR